MSRLAPLQTLNWLIRNMLVYVAFAAIVIFQSDIRRALAHFGQAPFFRYFNRQEAADETIEEIVVAATMLSTQKVGAIIAIEREIGLRNYIESGIPLDATLTYDLLVTIFQPGSPLHDGAVILQEGRVAAAACFLPLTVNPRVSRELGHAAPRRDRPDRRERRRGDRRSRRRRGQISLALERTDRARPDARRSARAAAALIAASQRRRRRRVRGVDAYERLMRRITRSAISGLRSLAHRAGDAAVADRGRRARRRAQPARAARVPEHPDGSSKSSGDPPDTSTCGCADRRRC